MRALAAAAAVISLLVLPPGRASWLAAAGLGFVTTASLAWMGHGAATEVALGPMHLLSDVVHALAAAVWIGALVALVLLALNRSPSAAKNTALHTALRRFSGVGSAAVAVLVITGVINAWVLVGPGRVTDLLATPYGRVLALKVLLFAAMLALAAVNRFRLTPEFGRALYEDGQPKRALAALRRSLALETGTALLVLLLVAWLGTLAPPAAG